MDQEYLFQHYHISLRKRGAEVMLSGLQNVKYEKFMSRPYVGQKLMVCFVLFFKLIIVNLFSFYSSILGNKHFGRP